MGLKSGSRDAQLDESEDETEDSADQQPEHSEADQESPTDSTDETTTIEETTDDGGADPTTQRPTMDSLPYKLRRQKVNEGREQVPFFLRKEVIDAEDDLQDTLEEELDEDVYKSDYREAAMIVAQRNPDLVAGVLREWGYDLDAR